MVLQSVHSASFLAEGIGLHEQAGTEPVFGGGERLSRAPAARCRHTRGLRRQRPVHRHLIHHIRVPVARWRAAVRPRAQARIRSAHRRRDRADRSALIQEPACAFQRNRSACSHDRLSGPVYSAFPLGDPAADIRTQFGRTMHAPWPGAPCAKIVRRALARPAASASAVVAEGDCASCAVPLRGGRFGEGWRWRTPSARRR